MNMLFETKYALRLLKKTPGYTATCVLVTAVGIAVSLVAFTIIYTFSMKPLEYADSDGWYSMMFSVGGGSLFSNTNAYFYQTMQENEFESFDILGRQYAGTSVFSDGDTSVRFLVGYQSSGLMSATTVKPYLGRLFQDSDSEVNGPATIVLTRPIWETFYNSDLAIIGKTTRIDGIMHTVIGVLPKGYNIGFSYDVYLPPKRQVITTPAFYGNGSPFIKLKEGASVATASLELNQLLNELKIEFPKIYLDEYQLVLSPANQLSPTLKPLFIMMSMMAGIFVLFSCLNTGSLLFAHTIEKHRELIIRNALGSSGWQLVKQSLLESFFICILGALLGVVISLGALAKIEAISATVFSPALVNNDHHFVITLSAISILFVVGVVSLMWLLSGMLPVMKAVRQTTKSGPANTGKGSVNERSAKGTSILVGFQVSFTCFLLIISALLVGTMDYFTNRDIGVNLNQKITAEVLLSDRYLNPETRLQYLTKLENELTDLNNVESVGFSSSLPSLGLQLTEYQLEDRIAQSPSSFFSDPIAIVSQKYFDTMDIDLIAGRNFDATDILESQLVAIVDQQFAERFWPGESAIGKRLQVNPEQDGAWLTIVGVTSHGSLPLKSRHSS